ncbi:MAG: hypothetical protein JW881_01625 [Spirochaetales bacterium]|nr:hypothetical protein [Spirochaetales bacterium]
MKPIIYAVIVLFFVSSRYGQAQTDNEPAWVIFEKAKAEYTKKEYGNALSFCKAAIQKKGIFPEAELLLGDIYRISDNPIAIDYYKQAYELKNFFEIPEDKYTVLYRMTDLYREEKNYREYSETLRTIIEEDADYYEEQFKRYRKEFYKIFFTDGLDRVLILHRIEDSQFVVKAHAEYGWYYYKTGMYEDSIVHSLFAVVGAVTEAFGEIRRYQPLYFYTTMPAFIGDAFSYEHIRSYLEEDVRIFELLYYLGCAVYVEIGYARAKQIWSIVAESPYQNNFKRRSQIQIQNPRVEELLVVPKKSGYEWEF